MDNFNNPNDPYDVGNQLNPYESNPQNDPYSSVPQNTSADYMPQDNSYISAPQNNPADYMPQDNVSSLDSVYNPNNQSDLNQSSTFNGYDSSYTNSDQNNSYMNQNPYTSLVPPVNNAYIPAPQINPQGMNNGYPYTARPQPPMTYRDPEKDRKNANTLCIISLICYFVPGLINFIYTFVTLSSVADYESYEYTGGGGSYLLSGLNFLAFIAAWVLMIVARVNYPNSKFAKVLMWVYIGLFILGIIATVVIIVTCAATLSAMCPD